MHTVYILEPFVFCHTTDWVNKLFLFLGRILGEMAQALKMACVNFFFLCFHNRNYQLGTMVMKYELYLHNLHVHETKYVENVVINVQWIWLTCRLFMCFTCSRIFDTSDEFNISILTKSFWSNRFHWFLLIDVFEMLLSILLLLLLLFWLSIRFSTCFTYSTDSLVSILGLTQIHVECGNILKFLLFFFLACLFFTSLAMKTKKSKTKLIWIFLLARYYYYL